MLFSSFSSSSLQCRAWLVLAVLYGCAATLLHETFSNKVVVPLKGMLGSTPTEYAFVALTLCAIGGLLWLTRGRGQGGAVWGRWLLLLGAAALCSVYLMVTRIEMAHFPQYAILSTLLRLGGISPSSTYLAGQCVSIADEARQYLLHPRYTGYFDWNDVLINSVGLCIGLLLMRGWGWQRSAAGSTCDHAFARSLGPSLGHSRGHGLGLSQSLTLDCIVGRVCGGLLVLALGLLLAGLVSGHVLTYVPVAQGHTPDPFPVIEGRQVLVLFLRESPAFWQAGPFGQFHVLNVLEGLVLVPVLSWLLFVGALPRRNR